MSVKRLIKQKSYEKVIYVLRRHWLIFIKTMLPYPILIAFPVVIYWVITREFSNLLTGEFSYPMLTVVASVYYFCVLLFAFNAFLDYYLDEWIVTNDRIINIEQSGLFGRKISEMDIYKVQDATSTVNGIFQTMFNFGHVKIQSAGEKGNFDFEQIKNPNEIRRHIIELADEDRKYHQSNGTIAPHI